MTDAQLLARLDRAAREASPIVQRLDLLRLLDLAGERDGHDAQRLRAQAADDVETVGARLRELVGLARTALAT